MNFPLEPDPLLDLPSAIPPAIPTALIEANKVLLANRLAIDDLVKYAWNNHPGSPYFMTGSDEFYQHEKEKKRLISVIAKYEHWNTVSNAMRQTNREQFLFRCFPSRFYLNKWAQAIRAFNQYYWIYGYNTEEEEDLLDHYYDRYKELQKQINVLSCA
jgi:hypothetical protein